MMIITGHDMRRSRGLRSKTRRKMKRAYKDRGKTPITKTLQKFNVGEKANIVIDPSIQNGQPHPRFHGLTGDVAGMQGDAYLVDVKCGKKVKRLIISPEHLKK